MQDSNSLTGSLLLGALPDAEREELLPKLEPVELPHVKVLYEIGDPMDHVYFPTSGLISLVSHTQEGGTIEVALVGREGMAGLPVFLGAERAQYRTQVQYEGSALRIKSDLFKQECEGNAALRRVLLRYTQAHLTEVTQATVCNRFHDVETRLCRWLLLAQDRAQTDVLDFTQQFLSDMLGIYRPAVTIAARTLQSAGLIDYVRGRITILDRQALESASCECYGAIKSAFDWLSRV